MIMQALKCYLLTTLFCSCVFVGFSHGDQDAPTYPCITDLLPCQPFIDGAKPPLPSCCVPLTRVVKEQKDCLCALFNNHDFLKTFNITQEKALALPKACAIKAEPNFCSPLANAPTPAPPVMPPVVRAPPPPVVPAAPPKAPSTSMACSHFIGGISLISVLMALVGFSIILV